MNNNKKLKFIALTLFVFIIILVGILVYTTRIYDQNKDQPASNTSAVVTGGNAASTATPPTVQTGADNSSQVKDTVDLKLYNYDAEDYDNPKEIVNVTVDKKLYQEDIAAAINKVLETTGLSIKKAELKDGLITVDLSKEVGAKFNIGSAGGITYTNILAMTILNLPDISKLKVTVDGVPNIESDHFSFNGIFLKSADGNKYELTAN